MTFTKMLSITAPMACATGNKYPLISEPSVIHNQELCGLSRSLKLLHIFQLFLITSFVNTLKFIVFVCCLCVNLILNLKNIELLHNVYCCLFVNHVKKIWLSFLEFGIPLKKYTMHLMSILQGRKTHFSHWKRHFTTPSVVVRKQTCMTDVPTMLLQCTHWVEAMMEILIHSLFSVNLLGSYRGLSKRFRVKGRFRVVVTVLLLVVLFAEPGEGKNATRRGVVRLAVIAPADHEHEQSLFRVLPAVQLAVRRISHPVTGSLPGWDIRVEHRDSQCSSTYGPLAAFEFYINKSAGEETLKIYSIILCSILDILR